MDGSGHTEPRPLSMLYCVDEPEVGGETLFVSGYEALANLEEGVRALAERMLVHYCLGGGGGDSDDEDDDEHDQEQQQVEGEEEQAQQQQQEVEGEEQQQGSVSWDPRVLESREAPSSFSPARRAAWEALHTHAHPLVKPHTV